MRFEYIVLLIIAFNVVTAVVKNRAKKKATEQAARTGRGAPYRAEEIEVEEQDEEEDEFQDPYAGHRSSPSPVAERGEGPRAGEDRNAERPVAEMPSMGRDILDQLARDLGFRLPKPSSPREAPVPESVIVSQREAELERQREAERERQRARDQEKARERAREQEREVAKAREKERLAASRTRETVPSRSIPASAVAVAPVSAAVPRGGEPARSRTASGSSPLRESLLGRDKLREAFILKEILDLPVSRRRR